MITISIVDLTLVLGFSVFLFVIISTIFKDKKHRQELAERLDAYDYEWNLRIGLINREIDMLEKVINMMNTKKDESL